MIDFTPESDTIYYQNSTQCIQVSDHEILRCLIMPDRNPPTIVELKTMFHVVEGEVAPEA